MLRAALAWVASASSRSGGANNDAKKITSQSERIMLRAEERRGPDEERTCADELDAAKGSERAGVIIVECVSLGYMPDL
jgi:hypothetical protein